MKSMRIVSLLFVLISALSLHAQEFVDKSEPDRLFDIGFRIGVNTSNRTFSEKCFQTYNVDNWGIGFDAGAVVDLNFRRYFSIQPGFFYDTRSGNYAYVQKYLAPFGTSEETSTQLGHYRTYNFTVPIMASFKFELSDQLRWVAEAGPYVQFKLHSTDGNKIEVIMKNSDKPGDYTHPYARTNSIDGGLKIGTGLLWLGHYSINVHYLAGFNNVWKSPVAGGKAKQWLFSIGYTL